MISLRRMSLSFFVTTVFCCFFSALTVYANASTAQTPQLGNSISEQILRERFEFDKSNEVEKNKIESGKMLVTAGSIIIGFIGTMLTIGIGIYSIRSQIQNSSEISKRQSEAAFMVKTAEIIMNSRNAFATHYRAKVLQAVFRDQIPEDFVKSFDPTQFRGGLAIDLRIELLNLLVANPDKQEHVIKIFQKLFPDTKEDPIFKTWNN